MEKEKESKKESLLTQDNSCQCPLFQLLLFTCSLSKNCKVLYPRSCYNDQDHGKYLHLDKLSKHSFIAFAFVNFKCKIYWFCEHTVISLFYLALYCFENGKINERAFSITPN